MVADPSRLRFYVDETSLGLGIALARARTDVVHAGHSVVPNLPTKLLDTEWMPRVAALGLVVIGRDKHLRTRLGEREMFQRHGLRVLRLAGRKDLSTWDAIIRLVHRWEDIERLMRDRPHDPWVFEVFDTSLKELPYFRSPVDGSGAPS